MTLLQNIPWVSLSDHLFCWHFLSHHIEQRSGLLAIGSCAKDDSSDLVYCLIVQFGSQWCVFVLLWFNTSDLYLSEPHISWFSILSRQ